MTITIGIACFVLVLVMLMQFKIVNETDITSIENMREAELKTELANWKSKYDEANKSYEETIAKIEEYKTTKESNEETEKLVDSELEQIIHSAGFYVRKAQTIKNLCHYFDTYHDNLAQLRTLPASRIRQELLALSGIGRETADTIMLYVLSKDTFIVDAYARRLFQRLEVKLPKTYDGAQKLIMPELAPLTLRGFQELHACIVLTGQAIKTEQDWQNSFLAPYQLHLAPRKGE